MEHTIFSTMLHSIIKHQVLSQLLLSLDAVERKNTACCCGWPGTFPRHLRAGGGGIPTNSVFVSPYFLLYVPLLRAEKKIFSVLGSRFSVLGSRGISAGSGFGTGYFGHRVSGRAGPSYFLLHFWSSSTAVLVLQCEGQVQNNGALD